MDDDALTSSRRYHLQMQHSVTMRRGPPPRLSFFRPSCPALFRSIPYASPPLLSQPARCDGNSGDECTCKHSDR